MLVQMSLPTETTGAETEVVELLNQIDKKLDLISSDTVVLECVQAPEKVKHILIKRIISYILCIALTLAWINILGHMRLKIRYIDSNGAWEYYCGKVVK